MLYADGFLDDAINVTSDRDVTLPTFEENRDARHTQMEQVVRRIQERIERTTTSSEIEPIHAREADGVPFSHLSSDYPTWQVECIVSM